MNYLTLCLCRSGCFATFGFDIRYSKTGNELVTEVLLKYAFSYFFLFGKSMQINALYIEDQSDVIKFY